MRLLVAEAGEQLLGVAEDQGPGEDLGGGVEGAEAGDELAPHEQEAEEGGDGAHGELEGGEGDGQAVGLGGAADAAQGGGGGHRGRGEADELDHQEVGRAGGALDDVVDVGVAGPDSWPVCSRADCWVGQTTTVWPPFSGWKQRGTAEGLMIPRGHADGQQGHDHRGDQQDVAEAATELLAQGGLAGGADAATIALRSCR